MADTQFHGLQTTAAPNDWTIPGSLEITLKAARAVFDGTAAVSAFLPALEIISDSGLPVGTYVAQTAVSAGASADASFAPFLRAGASSSSGGGIQYDVDNVGTWLDVKTTGFEPVLGNGIFLNATGDGNDLQLTAEGGINLDDTHGWGIVIKSTTGLGGSADIDALADRDLVLDGGRDVDVQAGATLNLTGATVQLNTSAAATPMQISNSGDMEIVLGPAGTNKLTFLGSAGDLIILDPTVLPVVNPGVPGALWNNGGVLHVS